MTLPAYLAAFGLWPAVVLLGVAVLGRRSGRVPPLASLALFPAAGMAILTFPLLLLAGLGFFKPVAIGIAGWLLSIAILMGTWRQFSWRGFRMTSADWITAAGIAVAAFFYLSRASDTSFGGSDQGVYANHAFYLARTGSSDVPYPTDDPVVRAAMVLPAGIYATQPAGTVQFLHGLPVWMAQSFACFGEGGVFGLSGAIAALNALIFFGLLAELLPRKYAAAGTLFFAFNSAQLWNARISLSEIFAQMFVWSALWLFVTARRERRVFRAGFSGFILGASCTVHLDLVLIWPCVFLAHLAHRLFEPETGAEEWKAFLAAGLGATLLALGCDWAWSAPYLTALSRPLLGVALVTALCAGADLAATPRLLAKVRPFFSSRKFLAAVGALLAALFIYGCWFRPWLAARGLSSSYRALAWPNLAAYLSLPVIAVAVAGATVMLWRIARRQMPAAHLLWLAIGVGVSALYLFHPLVDMRHFWASRRYIPVMVPAFIACATVGAAHFFSFIKGRPKLAAELLVAAGLCGFVWRSDRLIWKFREHDGASAQVRALAAALPAGAAVMIDPELGATWGLPLQLAWGHPVFTFDRALPGPPPILRLMEKNAPLFFLHHGGMEFPRFAAQPVGVFHPQWRETEVVRRAPPTRIATIAQTLVLTRLDAFRAETPLMGANLLNAFDPEIQVRGFYGDEDDSGNVLRWSGANPSVEIPATGPAHAVLEIQARSVQAAGTKVRVQINGRAVFDGTVAAGPWTPSFALNETPRRIDFAVSTFVPAKTDPASRDLRPLGIIFEKLRVVSPPPSAASPRDIPGSR